MQLKLGLRRLEAESLGGIGFSSHYLKGFEELLALTFEKSIGCEARNCSHRTCKSISERANDRHVGEVADELARHWKNQTGLNQVCRLQRWIVEEIGEREAGYG